MSFDLKCGSKKESIRHHEEGLFAIVAENDAYPALNWLWENFYSGPRITPERSNDLVHELIALQEFISEKSVLHTTSRLISFFSSAHVSDTVVTTLSD